MQHSLDINKFRRFSMCNCLTVRMEQYAKRSSANMLRTYTAHLMTPDLFLKKAKRGVHFNVPFIDFWKTKTYINTYCIPKKVDTFLFSTFNEIFHPNFTFDDGIRYVVPKQFRQKVLEHKQAIRKSVRRVNHIPINQYKNQLMLLKRKVGLLWKNVNKILIFYDHSRAPKAIRKRALEFNSMAMRVLNWPVIQIEEKYRFTGSWQHYSVRTYMNLLAQIEGIERQIR